MLDIEGQKLYRRLEVDFKVERAVPVARAALGLMLVLRVWVERMFAMMSLQPSWGLDVSPFFVTLIYATQWSLNTNGAEPAPLGPRRPWWFIRTETRWICPWFAAVSRLRTAS
jgi:hypothetical protein